MIPTAPQRIRDIAIDVFAIMGWEGVTVGNVVGVAGLGWVLTLMLLDSREMDDGIDNKFWGGGNGGMLLRWLVGGGSECGGEGVTVGNVVWGAGLGWVLTSVIETPGGVMDHYILFPICDVVMYKYYIGRIRMFEDKYEEARWVFPELLDVKRSS